MKRKSYLKRNLVDLSLWRKLLEQEEIQGQQAREEGTLLVLAKKTK